MNDAIPRFLREHRRAILREWRADLKDKFGHLEEDSRIWLAHELEELFDDISAKLDSEEIAAKAEQQSESIAPELFDSLEFASRIECLVSGMRCILRFVRELCEAPAEISTEEGETLVRELETSLRLQLHDEVQAFCRRWSRKPAVEESGKRGESGGA